MSHFTVLVVGENPEKQLAPYHEFECTGQDDEFVQEIDITEETRSEYTKGKVGRLRDPEGFLHDSCDDKFYRDPTEKETKDIGIGGSGYVGNLYYCSKDWGDGKGYRAKVGFIPNGFKEVEVKRSEVESFRSFVEEYHGKTIVPFGEEPDLNGSGDGMGENGGKHKYGYALVDKEGEVIKIVDRTNPNKKWDWHQLGGRWRGMFKVKTGADALVGNPGTIERIHGIKELPNDVADQAYKRDIDFQAMRDEKADEAGNRYDRLSNLFGGKIPGVELLWKDVLKGEETIEEKRKKYNDQSALVSLEAIRKRKDLNEEDRNLVVWLDLESYLGGREAYVGRAIRDAVCTFAVVKDGKWYERGDMGWWGFVSDEKDGGAWANEMYKLIESVPGDTLLSVFDCHI